MKAASEMRRFHVDVAGNRTTVSLAPVLAELLAVKLGAGPQGHTAVCTWLQEQIDRDPGAVAYGRASQRLAHLAVLAIADPRLVAKLGCTEKKTKQSMRSWQTISDTITCEMCGSVTQRNGSTQRFCGVCTTKNQQNYRDATREVRFELYRAIKEGRLPRAATLKCVDCGKQARDWDHRDYAKPLDVEPVCRSCNRKRGPALNHPTLPKGANAVGLVRDAA